MCVGPLTPWQTELSIKDRQKERIKVQDRQKKMFTGLNLLQYNVTNNQLVWSEKHNLFGKWFYLDYQSLLSLGNYNTLISTPFLGSGFYIYFCFSTKSAENEFWWIRFLFIFSFNSITCVENYYPRSADLPYALKSRKRSQVLHQLSLHTISVTCASTIIHTLSLEIW
jgi:hypothetical protein